MENIITCIIFRIKIKACICMYTFNFKEIFWPCMEMLASLKQREGDQNITKIHSEYAFFQQNFSCLQVNHDLLRATENSKMCYYSLQLVCFAFICILCLPEMYYNQNSELIYIIKILIIRTLKSFAQFIQGLAYLKLRSGKAVTVLIAPKLFSNTMIKPLTRWTRCVPTEFASK